MKNKRHIEWALEHVPLLRARGEEVTARIVARAIEQTQTLRVVISLVLTFLTLGGGWFIEEDILAEGSSPTNAFIIAAIAIGLLGYVGAIVSDAIVHKRISDLANG